MSSLSLTSAFFLLEYDQAKSGVCRHYHINLIIKYDIHKQGFSSTEIQNMKLQFSNLILTRLLTRWLWLAVVVGYNMMLGVVHGS